MKKTKNSFFMSRRLVKITVFILAFNLLMFGMPIAQAASITIFTDNLSRLKASTLADHEIKFVTHTGVGSAGATITATFGAAFTMGTFNVNNVDFAAGNSSNCAAATFTEKTLAASATASTWGVAQATQVITLTSPTNATTGELVAGNCVRLRIGANATTGGAGATQITNGSAGATTATIVIGGTFNDSGALFIPIISDDQVAISATVDPSISFSISDNSIGFGTLTSASARYATGDAVGNGSETSAHNLVVGTNSTSGYGLYVKGDTLTSGVNTITAIGGSMASSTPGSEQFGVRLSSSGGSGSSISPYNGSTSYAYAGTASTQSQIAQSSTPSANTTYSVYYLANIAPLTEAGAYTTTLTYTVVGSF
jgi:hypothetical protein